MSNADPAAGGETAVVLSPQDWWQGAAARQVMAALDGRARFVGGAVRDSLLGRVVNDVDLATPLLPQDVVSRAERAGIRAIPTGIDHGTVTLVAGRQVFEVTTLRRDVATDGRRATIAYSSDWAEDAGRRDFTINALFADAEGRVSDYWQGLADLAPVRIRFIGRAADRVREDYLRLLRFFRFHACYGQTPMDGEALAAAQDLAEGVTQLSAERIWAELKKLLAAPDPAETLQAMAATQILRLILPEFYLSGAALPSGGWSARLAALLPPATDLPSLGRRLRWSRQDLSEVTGVMQAALAAEPHPYGLLRQYGAAIVQAGLAVRRARGYEELPHWQQAAADWQPTVFPLSGRDFLARGHAAGPHLGRLLNRLEAVWEAEGCRLTKEELLTDEFLARVDNES